MSVRRFSAVVLALLSCVAAGCSSAGTGLPPAASPSAVPSDGSDYVHTLPNRVASWRPVCPNFSNVISFNASSVNAGDTMWLSSVMNVSGVSNSALIYMTNSTIAYTVSGSLQTLRTPSAVIFISSEVHSPVLGFNPFFNMWVEAVPTGTSGNVFLNGVEAALRQSLPSGVTPVTWTASFITDSSTVHLNWQWSAAAYTRFNSNPFALGVKVLDDSRFPPNNSDPAGTPELYKSFVTAGGTGNGGSNYTGTLGNAVGVTPCGSSATPTPSPSPTAPAYTALAADNGEANGQVNVARLALQSDTPTNLVGDFQLDAAAYNANTNFGILGNGASQTLIPFSLSGSSVVARTPIDISQQCVPQSPAVPCDGSGVVMPDASTAVVALNAAGSNYLLEVRNVSGSPSFSTIPIGGGAFVPEDTDSVAMSSDAKLILSRGAHVNVFKQTAPETYAEVNQFAQPDAADHYALRGREGMMILNMGSDYGALVTGTSASPQNGTLSFYVGLASTPSRITSTRIDPSLHAYSVATDGKTAFVGTDTGIAVVPGVNTESFSADTTSVVVPEAGAPGTSLVQISNVAVTPDGKWLVVMGLPATLGAAVPGGLGYLDVLPIIYGSSSVTLGQAVESVPIAVPNNDQLLVF